MRWVSWLILMICTVTVWPTDRTSVGWRDAAPGDVGDMQQAVDAAQIHEGAVIGDVLDHAFDHLLFLQARRPARCAPRRGALPARRGATPRCCRGGDPFSGSGTAAAGSSAGRHRASGAHRPAQPGRNATAPSRSTVKPPLTRPKITPVTRVCSLKAFSSLIQLSSRRALSRDSTASPSAFSTRSR